MMKKILIVALALVMVLSLTVGAMAEGAPDKYNGDTQTTIDATANTIQLVKSIVFVNRNGSAVYEPNITFSYTVTPAGVTDGAKSVTDDTPLTAHVFNGITDAITGTPTIIFSSENDAVTASSAGVEVEKTGNITVNPSAFPHAGIYRYVISEREVDVAAQGLTTRTEAYTTTRYLDVYIQNGESGLELYGAVIYKSTASGADDITTVTDKTTGFEPSISNLKDDTDVDRYVTYDFTVKKTVSGGLADKTHEFPFYITISNTINGAKYTYTPVGGTAAAETISGTGITKGADSTGSDVKLKHEDTVVFVGVPSAQGEALSVMVKEFNDTYDQYTATVTASNGGNLKTAPGNGVMAASTGTAALASAFDLKSNNAASQLITVNNNLQQISPTGVVLRVAPYALILGAGIVLLLISRRKAAGEEKD